MILAHLTLKLVNIGFIIALAFPVPARHATCHWNVLQGAWPEDAGFTKFCNSGPEVSTKPGDYPEIYRCYRRRVAGWGKLPGELEFGETRGPIGKISLAPC